MIQAPTTTRSELWYHERSGKLEEDDEEVADLYHSESLNILNPLSTITDHDDDDPSCHDEMTERATTKNNNDTEHDAVEDMVIDKNILFVQQLEEKKRKEKEAKAKEAERKQRMRLKLQNSILKQARAKKKPSPEVPVVESPSCEQPQDQDEEERRRHELEKSKQQKCQAKKLKEKQQLFLHQLMEKKQLKAAEELGQRKKDEKRKQAVKDAVLGQKEIECKFLDEPQKVLSAGSAVAAIRTQRGTSSSNACEGGGDPLAKVQETPLSPEEKMRLRQERLECRQRQQSYIQLLTDQRKEKQRLEMEKQAAEDKKRKYIRDQAQNFLIKCAEERTLLMKEEEALEKVKEAEAEEEPVKVDVDAMVSRLSKLKTTDQESIPEARDLASFKKRQGLAPDTKIFSLTGCYPALKQALESRGWYYNSDPTSPFFDLKWTLKSDDLKSMKQLSKDQYINHFGQNTAITTKSGLMSNLKRLHWFEDTDVRTLFPRAYDLTLVTEIRAFQDDFRTVFVESLLKQLVDVAESVESSADDTKVLVNQGLLDLILRIGHKRLDRLPDEQLDDPVNTFGTDSIVSDREWKYLLLCHEHPERCHVFAPFRQHDLDRATYCRPSFLRVVEEESPSASTSNNMSRDERRECAKLRRREENLASSQEQALVSGLKHQVVFTRHHAALVLKLVQDLAQRFPQFRLNGTSVSKNVWIIKPAGSSRGRGIRVFNDLQKLFDYAQLEQHKENQWVVQKYMENPLLISNRKFDIRQWVLVTNWNPLTVWFNGECYLRFCVDEYSLENLDNAFVHLANNSISKHSDKFYQTYDTGSTGHSEPLVVEGNMWTSRQFETYLRSKESKNSSGSNHTKNLWTDHIQAQMKKIVISSLLCAQDSIKHRKNACELYGYDFMITDEYEPYLIEINSSPACDYSTPITEKYVKEGLEDIVKIIVDHREYEQLSKRKRKKRKRPSTGNWDRIYKGEWIPQPVSAFGASFEVKGAKMAANKKRHHKRASMFHSSSTEDDDSVSLPVDKVPSLPTNPFDSLPSTATPPPSPSRFSSPTFNLTSGQECQEAQEETSESEEDIVDPDPLL